MFTFIRDPQYSAIFTFYNSASQHYDKTSSNFDVYLFSASGVALIYWSASPEFKYCKEFCSLEWL